MKGENLKIKDLISIAKVLIQNGQFSLVGILNDNREVIAKIRSICEDIFSDTKLNTNIEYIDKKIHLTLLVDSVNPIRHTQIELLKSQIAALKKSYPVLFQYIEFAIENKGKRLLITG